ncbi:N-acetyltransferase [uncultured Roseobacter sp.]|uniref:GNAT family N-acetyltransferase n=1 Tax=uncultured Roseobacter sp. TaxID=114847 RepID=UPI00260A6C3F|nr:N-acetyltransferase [uncultured Roseobacter sp.]
MTLQLTAARPDVSVDHLADLLWSTDPALWAFLCPEKRLFHEVLALEWPASQALLSHRLTTVAMQEDELLGLCTGYRLRDFETNFKKSMQLQPSVLSPAKADHLRDGLIWMDRLFPTPREGAFHIMELALTSAAQGHGLAKALLSDAVERAAAAGCQWLTLDVAAQNDAVGFYRHFGFVVELEKRIPMLAENHGIGTHLHMVRAIP